MSQPTGIQESRRQWEASFDEQVARGAYNTAPVEALARTMAYYLRDRFAGEDLSGLRMLEMGCGAGPNLVWLAQKGIRVSGIDISSTALDLARRNLDRHACSERVDELIEGSVDATPFADDSFDGIVEACVFQHLGRRERAAAFNEVRRLLKPGGVFIGYMLETGHTIFQEKRAEQLADDPGTLILSSGGSKIHLSNLGVSHFFSEAEIHTHLSGFRIVDPCLTTYYLPQEEAGKRGYKRYLQSMWTVYAIK
jgi:SAM-dependent methyltransferase